MPYNPELLVPHPATQKLADILMTHCENDAPHFFKLMLAYSFNKIAASMRTSIQTSKEKLPINGYFINLAPSGFGKGKSMGFIKNQITMQFHDRFENEALPALAERRIAQLAHTKSVRNNTDIDRETEILRAEYEATGEWIGEFDSATVAALKQFRHKLLLTESGSLNFEIDEIGDNLTGNADAFSKFLELYDTGELKESLTKNTKENKRLSKVKGATPTNMIMFGDPGPVLDGAKVEEEFYNMNQKGFARRCFFGFYKETFRDYSLTAEEMFDRGQQVKDTSFLSDFADKLCALADPINMNTVLHLNKDEEILWFDYTINCRKRARDISEFDSIRKRELEHRHFKALKLAGVFAFIDGSATITEQHLYNAFHFAEESGEHLGLMLNRDKPYVKVAKYLGSISKNVTLVDLAENLPCFKGSQSQKSELLTMATAWGYSNNVVIKKSYENGIEFISADSLEETSLDKLIVSYSTHLAYNYINESVSWENLGHLTQTDGYHWVNHRVHEGHRCEDKAIQGFNTVVIDVDGGTALQTAKMLLKDYKAMYYTTKRHQTEGEDRFRIVLPIKYTLKLDAKDYKEFMSALYEWLPFAVDDQTNQRARKWMSHTGNLSENDGELLDPLQFIPRTSKSDERRAKLIDQKSLTNIERWFINNTGDGNRSNQLIKYAYLLVDSGRPFAEVESGIYELNNKIPEPMPEEEIASTVLVSARKAYSKQAAA